MTELSEHLRRRIADEGPLSVHDFMAEALSHPQHGYYMGRIPLGAAGDFTTAPEISQMFGELVGLWCAVVWQAMGSPEAVKLVELGPGRGTLMKDTLRAAEALPPFRAAIEAHLVDISPVLRTSQRETLADAGIPISWHDSLEEVPAGRTLVIANEFFDALPIHQYQRTADGWCERQIDGGDNGAGFRFVLSPPLGETPPLPPKLFEAPEGSIVEVCPGGREMARALAQRVVDGGGSALIVDYGHGESAIGDTFQAVKEHAYFDALSEPGNADLTAHVDFASLARAAYSGGAEVYGPTPQGVFLERLGIQTRGEALLAAAEPEQHEEILSAHRRLVHPEEMGVLFKVMALGHPELPPPPGFS